jgi:hypothetical protein
MARDDRDLGFNLDADPEDEITVYDDELAGLIVVAGLAYVGWRLLKGSRGPVIR